MKKNLIALSMAALAFIAFAPFASAHEHDTFKIGNAYYLLTVGSLNEPVIVDNISGVDFRVSRVASPNGTMNAMSNGTPITGLESTLKVELGAGDKKEVLPLDPADTPGSYTANFIPTVPTTYTYRIFGTIAGTPVDLTFSCVPGAVSESTTDNAQVKVSDAVTRMDKIGAFGCPAARAAEGFPESALSSYELNQNIQNAANAAKTEGAASQTVGIIGLIAGIAGIVIGIAVWRKK